jgi:hypothetical protein
MDLVENAGFRVAARNGLAENAGFRVAARNGLEKNAGFQETAWKGLFPGLFRTAKNSSITLKKS